jgi:hypothetical protein
MTLVKRKMLRIRMLLAELRLTRGILQLAMILLIEMAMF